MATDFTQPKLYVVRSSAAKVDASSLPEDWRLSPEGILLTIPIAEASFWSGVAAIYHGPEVSSEQTARLISRRWQLPTEYEWSLKEVVLTPWGSRQQHQWQPSDLVRQHFEDSQQAGTRALQCIRRLAERHRGQSLAVVAQGKILVALYSCLLGRTLGQADWQSLRSPDLSVIDLATWKIEHGFFSHLEEPR